MGCRTLRLTVRTALHAWVLAVAVLVCIPPWAIGQQVPSVQPPEPGRIDRMDAAENPAAKASPLASATDPLGGHEFTVAIAWSKVFFRTFPDEVAVPVNKVGSTVYQANDSGHAQPLLQYISPGWEFLEFKDAGGRAAAGVSLLGAAASFRANSTFDRQGPLTGEYLLLAPFLFVRGGPLFGADSNVHFRGGWAYGAAALHAEADYYSLVNQRGQHYRRDGSAWDTATLYLWELHWDHWVLSRRSMAITKAEGRERFAFQDFSLALGYHWNFGSALGKSKP